RRALPSQRRSAPPSSQAIRRSIRCRRKAGPTSPHPEEPSMSRRPLSRSLFRPPVGIDQSVLEENRGLIRAIDRRKILRGSLSLGALTMLTGCDVTRRDSVQGVLQAVSAWNDRAQALLFRPNHLAPTFSPDQVVKPPRFNAFYDVEDVVPVDGSTWRLELA